MLLYCKAGAVLAWHDESNAPPVSAYGRGVSVVPWDNLGSLARIGDAPEPYPDGQAALDTRLYAAPTPASGMAAATITTPKHVAAGIEAGTITTLAQVDAA